MCPARSLRTRSSGVPPNSPGPTTRPAHSVIVSSRPPLTVDSARTRSSTRTSWTFRGGPPEGEPAAERRPDAERCRIQPDRAGEPVRRGIGFRIERELGHADHPGAKQRRGLMDADRHRERWVEAGNVEVDADLPPDRQLGRLECRGPEAGDGELKGMVLVSDAPKDVGPRTTGTPGGPPRRSGSRFGCGRSRRSS